MTEILPVKDDDTTQKLPGKPLAKRPGYFRREDGIIVDKNGKPCRSCNSYKDLAAASKMFNSSSAISATSSTAVKQGQKITSDMFYKKPPPDVEELGRSSWTLLHSLAATYPHIASDKEQQEMRTFMSIFSRVYPCGWCAGDFQEWMKGDENRIERFLGTRQGFGDWMCRAHNDVNRKLGKREFDCKRWMERWGGDEDEG